MNVRTHHMLGISCICLCQHAQAISSTGDMILQCCTRLFQLLPRKLPNPVAHRLPGLHCKTVLAVTSSCLTSQDVDRLQHKLRTWPAPIFSKRPCPLLGSHTSRMSILLSSGCCVSTSGSAELAFARAPRLGGIPARGTDNWNP
jgi:hypothetical protein